MRHSPGWYAHMQGELDKEMRQKEYEAKRREWDRQKAEREEWKREHMSEDKCPKCGSVMYLREGKYGKFYQPFSAKYLCFRSSGMNAVMMFLFTNFIDFS